MAEAVKPVTSNSSKRNKQETLDPPLINTTSSKNEDNSSNDKIDDISLQKRLKSLTSFINNLEPSEDIVTTKQSDTKIESTQLLQPNLELNNKEDSNSNQEIDSLTNNKYYEMISEKARLKLENDSSVFSDLNSQLNVIKIKEDSKESPSAPLIEHDLESINQAQHQHHQSPIFEANQTTVVDFNLEKIKQMNQLNYPRLAWNKLGSKHQNAQNEEIESTHNDFQMLCDLFIKKNQQIDSELMRFFELDQLCKDLECYYKCKQIQSENFDANLNDFIQIHSVLNEFQFDSNRKSCRLHEFYELCKDYYEARQLVGKCVRYMNEFKWQFIANQMRTIWSFEKYTIESNGMCGDQQQCKHELTSEKAYLNKTEITKLQTMLFELRFNLIKSGLISSQFCSKLAKVKIESYLHDFLLKFKAKNEFLITKTGLKTNDFDGINGMNQELKTLIDILIYFNRKQCKPSFKLFQKDNSNKKNSSKSEITNENNIYYEIDDNCPSNTEEINVKQQQNEDQSKSTNQCDDENNYDDIEEDPEQNDELFRMNIEEWFKVLSCLLLNQTELYRSNLLEKLNDSNISSNQQLFFSFSNLHFDNIFFILQHLLRSPESFPTKFSYLFQIPLIFSQESNQNIFKNLNLNTSQSDPLVNMYFDFYLKLFASFSYDIKYRRQFLFVNSKSGSKLNTKSNILSQIDSANCNDINTDELNWQLIDLDGDLESVESVLIEISEDDLIKLYYQLPFNNIYSFLWFYLKNQTSKTPMMPNSSSKLEQIGGDRVEFRVRYVTMKILSFLDYLSRLSIRTLLIYNRLKYKNFCKLVGKTLKEAIKFAFLLKDSSLQLHFDNFVKRIFTTIIYSSRVKSIRWIILSQLNIGELCLRTKWMILSIMCGIDVFHQNFEHLFNETIISNSGISSHASRPKPKPKDYVIQAVQNDLEALLSQENHPNSDSNHCHKLTDIELLSFMRTLHFLISLNRNKNEPESLDENEDEEDLYDFMNCVVKVLFKISYCYVSTRDICHKEGNSLLFAVCSAYPKLISTVLMEIDINLNLIGKRALFLTAELPFNMWLSSINCESDLTFLEKCLLFSPTNSILFRIAVNCIDNLNFNQDTTNISRIILQTWLNLNKNNNNPKYRNLSDCIINSKETIDIAHIVKIKLAIILFELHTRLTIYNYFNKTANESSLRLVSETSQLGIHTNSQSNQLFLTDLTNETVSSPIMKLNITSKEELNVHYSRLAKEKRLVIVNWIWTTFYRMNLFILIDQSQTIDYLEELSIIYSSVSRFSGSNITCINSGFLSNHQRYLQMFYKIYLSHQTSQQQLVEMSTIFQEQQSQQTDLSSNSTNTSNIPPLVTILHPKCPLECYMRLIFSRSGHDLNYLFDHGVDLVQNVLNTHKKQTQLQQTAYYLIFDWFENIIFKYSTVKLNERRDESLQQVPLLYQFRQIKKNNILKLSTLLLIIFNPNSNGNASKIIDMYTAQIYKRLEHLKNIPSNASVTHKNQLEENFQNYLYLWLEILITTIKNWHKYKNVVKIIDFLIAYSIQYQTKIKNNCNLNNEINEINVINFNLLDELMSYVKIDFGIEGNQQLNLNETLNGNTSQHQQQQQVHNQPNNSWTLNWLTTSLSYVVNTTATQVNSTVNAALNVVHGSTGNQSGDFESNYQQFTYDKRLYKECPYVGFYLSLCEERIEAELSLWTIFRSFLLGASTNGEQMLDTSRATSTSIATNNSPSFIESCWRKTLNVVNKTHSLNLNFTPNRLMLFKWSERAIDLPCDHPLLILYWQKFFKIYLDRDYHTILTLDVTNSSHRGVDRSPFDLELTSTSDLSNSSSASKLQSSTFKLFTSTTQLNSLLKQMKKQLELTSEHYAYQCTDRQSGQSQPSAPLSSYEFNEFVSKLYYALSLWIDETRLHDPELYLPALPVHYQPNLLAKIFAKHSDLWIQYIDFNKLNYHLGLIVNPHIKDLSKNETSNEYKISLSKEENNLFFKQSDRFLLNIPSLTQLNLTFSSPLKEKFGNGIENILQIETSDNRKQKNEADLILNICENEIRNIFKYNKEVINHTLNNMLKLDDKLTSKLLLHLWHNEVCEKYVQVPCSSLINPMHQCTRPAMVKFVYEVATKRDHIRHEIKENRLNHDKLISNLIENTKSSSSNIELNKFPHDEVIKSMVALNQLVKRLLRNHHIYQQQFDCQNDYTNQFLLTRLFYLLIDLYETQMHHPNDLLNSNKKSPTYTSDSTADQQFSDSIHSYMFDLINMIGSNFIQCEFDSINKNSQALKKRNQKILLEKIIQKLTSTITLTSESSTSNSSSSSSSRRSNILLNNLTRNKLSLMELCAQYVEPNDLDLFNEFYTNILCSITSILLNENPNCDPNSTDLVLAQNSCDTVEMVNQKFSIVIQLLSKFSFINLNKLLKEMKLVDDSPLLNDICATFVEININFLMDLKFEFLNEQAFSGGANAGEERQLVKEKNLKQIVDQCIDNFVSILNVNYPCYFEYMLKKCLDFSSKNLAFKYGSRHLMRFNTTFKQNELVYNVQSNKKMEDYLLSQVKFQKTFEFLSEYFNFERNRFRSQKSSFYAHWCISCRELADVFTNLFTIYFDRFVFKDLIVNFSEEELETNGETQLIKNLMKNFSKSYDSLWEILINLYLVWIEPSAVKEITSQSLINVKEIYEYEIALVGQKDSLINKPVTSPGAAILLMFDSFLYLFHTVLERLSIFSNLINVQHIGIQLEQNSKNYALNKLFHFYYEQIACALSSSSSINDNTLDCYHRCLSKYSSSWFGSGQFEPDYRSINIISELCLAQNNRLIKYLAFDLVSYLDLNRISESFFRKSEIQPIQINDLLKCWLQLLTEFCLRDSIRESSKFDSMLRPVYNQAEVLQCWSMLSDTSYSDVVIQRFSACADYKYAFASRGLARGLLINILKSSAEFYNLGYRNSLSCFSSAKRRCYLKAICELLLKPSVQIVKSDHDSFQNCILNLLTDIETFSISTEDETSNNIKHQIQLLIDEFLCLICSKQNKQVSEIYMEMLESWIASSRDSPILLHLINRLSRNFNLLTESNTHEKYCNLIELCIEIYFETNRTDNNNVWISVMNDIEFKLHGFESLSNEVSKKSLKASFEHDFELKCLQNSAYLLLNGYMTQRFAVYKATYTENSIEFFDSLLKYTSQILNVFFNNNNMPNSKNLIISRPKPSKEEKFILIVNKLIEFYLNVMQNSNSSLIESNVGEQLVQLATLLTYYGEDSLTNQNPLNDGQSIGSDLLSSIGFNILAKKSQFSVNFRFYCKCMSICILKQIIPTKNESVDASTLDLSQNNVLFPNLNQVQQKNSPAISCWLYKVHMSPTDLIHNDADLIENDSSSPTHNSISSSLPNPSFLSPSKMNSANSPLASSSSSLVNSFNQKFKQAAYQFHLIFQNKIYSTNSTLIELANYVNKNLQNSSDSQNFCLPQIYTLSKYLSENLFKEKYYLI